VFVQVLEIYRDGSEIARLSWWCALGNVIEYPADEFWIGGRIGAVAGEHLQVSAKVERGMVFTLEAYDWNCSQHITPRYSEVELQAMADFLLAHGASATSQCHITSDHGAG